MNKKSMLFGATALILGAVTLIPQTVLAYKGDHNVQGPNFTVERHDAMTQAFANKDYNAWKALMDGKGITRRINAENFARFAEAHDLALLGENAKADAIRVELGLGQQNGSGMGQGSSQGSRINR